MTPYEYRVGEDINVAIDALSGKPADFTVTAFITRSNAATRFRRDPNFVSLPLAVAPRAAQGSIPAGWNVTLPAAQSAALQPGLYGIDAVAVGPGGSSTVTSRTALVLLTASALPLP